MSYFMPQTLPPSDAEVYARQLFEKCHGYPLWRPEPYGSSPAYLTKGISVGDVGYVTRSGGFETLFNICLEADDPANYNGVPPNFERLIIPEARLDKAPCHHQRNSRIVNGKNVGRSIGLGAGATDPVSQLLGAGADVQYTWQTAEGAILHLPNGAMRFDCPPGLFHKYIKRHAQNWDVFINDTLQCNLPPGSIYLVTSCDKTDEWMLGSFHQESASREISLQISTLNLIEGRISFAYHWDRTSPLVCRDHIRRIEANSMDVEAPPDGGTHCVFLQGFRITVKKKKMSKKRQIEVEPISESPLQENRKRQRSLFSRSVSNSGMSWTVGCENEASTSTSGYHRSQELEETIGSPASTSSTSDSVIIEDISGSQPDWHPSVLWNERLFEIFPDATIAFTHDTDIPLLNDMDYATSDDKKPKAAIRRDDTAFWNFETSNLTPSIPCSRCKLRKVKCDRAWPACSQCTERDWVSECSYEPVVRKDAVCRQCWKRRIQCDKRAGGCSNCERRQQKCSLAKNAMSAEADKAETGPAGEPQSVLPGASIINENEPIAELKDVGQGSVDQRCSRCHLEKIECQGDGPACDSCEVLRFKCDRSASSGESKQATIQETPLESASMFMDPPGMFSTFDYDYDSLSYLSYPTESQLPYPSLAYPLLSPELNLPSLAPMSPPLLYEPSSELNQWKSSSRNGSETSLNSIENIDEGGSSRMSMRYNPLRIPGPATRNPPSRASTISRRESIRAQRIESETRRREELRDGYRRLIDVLPPSSNKPTKPGLLDRAVQYIRAATNRKLTLEEEAEEKQRELMRLRAANEALMMSAASRRQEEDTSKTA